MPMTSVRIVILKSSLLHLETIVWAIACTWSYHTYIQRSITPFKMIKPGHADNIRFFSLYWPFPWCSFKFKHTIALKKLGPFCNRVLRMSNMSIETGTPLTIHVCVCFYIQGNISSNDNILRTPYHIPVSRR